MYDMDTNQHILLGVAYGIEFIVERRTKSHEIVEKCHIDLY